VSTPTDTNRELLTVVATMRAKAGKEDELRAALESVIAPTLAEEGNVNYDLHQGVQDPAVFTFYENWTSADALDQHLKSPHMAAGLAGLPALIDGELIVQTLRRIG
jgi:quinol monooxygenase YgiN